MSIVEWGLRLRPAFLHSTPCLHFKYRAGLFYHLIRARGTNERRFHRANRTIFPNINNVTIPRGRLSFQTRLLRTSRRWNPLILVIRVVRSVVRCRYIAFQREMFRYVNMCGLRIKDTRPALLHCYCLILVVVGPYGLPFLKGLKGRVTGQSRSTTSVYGLSFSEGRLIRWPMIVFRFRLSTCMPFLCQSFVSVILCRVFMRSKVIHYTLFPASANVFFFRPHKSIFNAFLVDNSMHDVIN